MTAYLASRDVKTFTSVMDITDLPTDLFLAIISLISAEDFVRCRSVCRKWNSTFLDPVLNRFVILQHYPKAREVRFSHAGTCWTEALSRVVTRYHSLKEGKPRWTEKLALGKSTVVPEWSKHYPVSPWLRHLEYEGKKTTFEYPDSLWTYDDGLLVFPSSKDQGYMIYDIEKSISFPIALPPGSITRRISLKYRVLIVEWCEAESYHQLNENEWVHRHFATAYDIVHGHNGDLVADFRNEWKIHFLGLPLNSTDRFYSTHNSNHYAIYLWQPNRSAWGEDEPIESLAVWDISSSSSYRPSQDPTGKCRPPGQANVGPKVIKRLSFLELEFYKIRQRSTPTFRALRLDENNVYVIEEDHRWLVGPQAGHTLPRLHKVQCVGLPFGHGPVWQDECGADGNIDLSFCQNGSDKRTPEKAPCWRHEEFPYLTITEAVDLGAGVRFCARQCFMLETLSVNIKPSVHMISPDYEVSLKDDLWHQLLAVGKTEGDERWLIGQNTNQQVVILHFDCDSRPD